jgi:CheY-like chemotaxis protein
MRLQQARRLETVGALASGIAHNFNNIVGAILGFTEMAQETSSPTPIFGEIRRAGERARELIEQILAFTRPRDAHRHPVSIDALVTESTSLLHASLPATIELVVRTGAEAVVVSGVPAQLQQVILNLCNNAAQAMDYNGRIELELEVSNIVTARQLSHGEAVAPGRYATITVGDAGRGIDEAVFGRIFKPFFTTRATGNGLGLATIRDIVHEHGGAINVQSIVGTGSRFEVWLPCIDDVILMLPEDTAMPPFGHGETVLVVEEDSERLPRDEEILAALGYEPVGFARATDAQAACLTSPERFDAVVVGNFVSAATALDLAAQLHATAPSLLILLAAASAGEFDADALIAAGISDVVSWPIAAAEIAAVLQNSLREPKYHHRPAGTRSMHFAADVRPG